MKFLLDENRSPRLALALNEAGHDAVHVLPLGLASASDNEILNAAAEEDRVLISADNDFGRLLARGRLSAPSLILFRNTELSDVPSQAAFLLERLPYWEPHLFAGSIVVIGESNVRIRRLPLTPGDI